jgi:hypothetical protein
MTRRPISTDPVGKGVLLQGIAAKWLFVCLFFYLIGLAILKASAVSVVISLFALVVLIMLLSGDEIEIKTLEKNIKWYKFYSLFTFLSGASVSFVLPFEFASPFSFLLLFLFMLNGMLIWPYVTVSTFKKNYTSLFGMYDA